VPVLHERPVEAVPAVTYREVAPPAAFARDVVCTWTNSVGAAAPPHLQSVLPDGCIDLLWIGDAAPVVVGPMTHREVTPILPGAGAVGIRFAPGHAAAVLGVAASAIVDLKVEVADLWRGPIAEPLDPDLPPEARRRIAEARFVVQARPVDPGRCDRRVSAAVAWLARNPTGRIRDLARMLELSERQLHRRFLDAVGYAPKTFQRIARFQHVLALAASQGDLADLAIAAGYADQAHMTREVRELAGATPTAVLGHASSALAMSDLFKTDSAPGG
jgi:AraC-like DNA-binding protein